MKKLWFKIGCWWYGHFYFLSFVEEFGMNPNYANWTFGRMEVFYPRKIAREDGYQDEEVWYCTPKKHEFWAFRDKYDFKHVSRREFLKIKREIQNKYQNILENKKRDRREVSAK